MCRDKVVRRTLKQSDVAGVVPTIPASDNHRDGSWIATDIYIGEEFFNSADGITYTRSANGIIIVGQNNPNGIVKRYVALLTQVGIDAPLEEIVKEDSIGGAMVYSRSAVGNYRIANTDKFPIGRTSIRFGNELNDGVTNFGNISVLSVAHVSDDSVYFNTFGDGGIAIDELLLMTTIIIEIYPEPPIS